MPKGKIKNKTQVEKKKQTTEPDSDMPGMLELLGKEFKAPTRLFTNIEHTLVY